VNSRPAQIVGVDVRPKFLRVREIARQQLGLDQLPESLDYLQLDQGASPPFSDLDGIYSWSVFEHVDRNDLEPIVLNFLDMLRPGGAVLTQVEPLYFSAFGSHLERLVADPWAHLILSPAELEERVESFQGELPDLQKDIPAREGVTPEFKQWLLGEYRSLNQIRAHEITDLFRNAGFEIVREHCTKRPEVPPAELVARYDEDTLTTNGIFLVARKPK